MSFLAQTLLHYPFYCNILRIVDILAPLKNLISGYANHKICKKENEAGRQENNTQQTHKNSNEGVYESGC